MSRLSKRLSVLYTEYPGDDAWQEFINNFPEINYSDFSDFNIPNDIARAIIGKVGPMSHSKKWLISDIPALGHGKPIEILRNYKNGVRIIRSVLMRMH